jgi:hypothetical protein
MKSSERRVVEMLIGWLDNIPQHVAEPGCVTPTDISKELKLLLKPRRLFGIFEMNDGVRVIVNLPRDRRKIGAYYQKHIQKPKRMLGKVLARSKLEVRLWLEWKEGLFRKGTHG